MRGAKLSLPHRPSFRAQEQLQLYSIFIYEKNIPPTSNLSSVYVINYTVSGAFFNLKMKLSRFRKKQMAVEMC
jgi:hypothetical protein